MDLRQNMSRLNKIMKRYDLHPIVDKSRVIDGKTTRAISGETSRPIARIIFCKVLAEAHPELLEAPGMGGYLEIEPIRKTVGKYLNYTTHNSVKSALNPERMESIKGHKSYYRDYKMIKAEFNNDDNHIELQKYKKLKESANLNINRIIHKMIEE
mgnify:CR=1 FL=1